MFIQISFLRLLINKIKSVCDKKSYTMLLHRWSKHPMAKIKVLQTNVGAESE